MLTPDDALRWVLKTGFIAIGGGPNVEMYKSVCGELLDAREALRELLRWSEPTLQALNVLGAGESAPSRGGVWKIMKYAKSLLPEYGEADDEGGA